MIVMPGSVFVNGLEVDKNMYFLTHELAHSVRLGILTANVVFWLPQLLLGEGWYSLRRPLEVVRSNGCSENSWKGCACGSILVLTLCDGRIRLRGELLVGRGTAEVLCGAGRGERRCQQHLEPLTSRSACVRLGVSRVYRPYIFHWAKLHQQS